MCAGEAHTWHYSGITKEGDIPEGMLCDCKIMISHYDVCPSCNRRSFKPISLKLRQGIGLLDIDTVRREHEGPAAAAN